jgi:hypothetical protein
MEKPASTQQKVSRNVSFLCGNGLGGCGLLSLLGEEPLRVFTSDTAEELSRLGLGNAVGELDTTGEGLVGDLVVGDVLSDDVPQPGFLLGVFGDESGGLLLWDDEGERQFSMEFVGDTNDADLGNERMLDQVGLHLGGSNLETADLQHLLETIDDEDLHVLVDCNFVTGADPTVDESFFGGFFVVAVARSHRLGLDNQFSGLVEAGKGTVSPLDTGDNTGQENTGGAAGLVALLIVGLHTDHTSLGETVALEDGDLREKSGELLEPFGGERSGTAQDGAKAGEIELPRLGTLAEHDSDRWDEEEVADLVSDDALEHTREAEFGHDHDRTAAVQLEEQVVEHSVDV